MIGRSALLGLTLLASACAAEAGPERPSEPVVDEADIISPAAEQALDKKLRRYWDEKETAIVIATMPELKNESIEIIAKRMYNQWGIGSAKTQRGVLVLIAPAERQARIEVGCGLETVVTNDAARQILDDDLLPRFAAGDFDGGTAQAVAALMTRIETAKVTPGPVSPFCVEIMKEAA
ncbi:MAG: TPM domain-containing protein [Porphyrobacter sp.]|nr:TPM domain-containing protein [Porphyrobacter sp.]